MPSIFGTKVLSISTPSKNADTSVHTSMLGQSTQLQVILQQSAKNTASLPLQTCEKNQWTFSLKNTGVDFTSCGKFANIGSFEKVSILFQSIIP